MPGLVPFTYDIAGFILLKATSIVVIILKCFNKSVVGKKKTFLCIFICGGAAAFIAVRIVLHSLLN